MFVCTVQWILVVVSEDSDPSTAALRMASVFEKYVELYCRKSIVWFVVPLSYNIFIMLLCAWIGFVTRKLPNNFNESWFIFISVSTTLFAWAVFIPAYFTTSYVYLQSTILGFALVLNCFVTLICQYVPILYALAFVPADKTAVTGTIKTINTVAPSDRD